MNSSNHGYEKKDIYKHCYSVWQRWNYNRWNVQCIIHERTNSITTNWFVIQEFAQWIYPGFLDEIYNAFTLRSEVIKVCGHVMRRYQISNKWVKKVVQDCKGKPNISDVKCMWILVIILLIKIVVVKEWRSYIAMGILRREVLRVIRLIKWNML